jgi:hypothetical protein
MLRISSNIRTSIFSLCLCVLVVNNIYAKDVVTGATKKVTKRATKSSEEQWLQAVRKADVKSAIKFARDKASFSSTLTHKEYKTLAAKQGIDPRFLNKPFNNLDFKLWYDAWFLKNKLKEFGVFDLKDNNSKLKRIFEKVTERIKPFEKEKAIISWPTGIWVRKFGLCDRQSWLFAELAYQAGFETQIIYLVNPDNGQSPHTICEVLIKDDKGKVTRSVADPLSKVLLEGKSVADLANDKELMKKIWPDKKEWWVSLPNSIFWTPSYPQDYCIKNQLLYKRMHAELGSVCPRFGESPMQRMFRYIKMSIGMGNARVRTEKVNGEILSGQMSDNGLLIDKPFKMGLWYYPFRVLKRELEVKK